MRAFVPCCRCPRYFVCHFWMSRLPVFVLTLSLLLLTALANTESDIFAWLRSDDECAGGVCALNQLHIRASMESRKPSVETGSHIALPESTTEAGAENATDTGELGMGGEGILWKRRHILRRFTKWKPTPILDEDKHPSTCGGRFLKQGLEGCCAGKVYDLSTTACCGSLTYRIHELKCCHHGNRTASIYRRVWSMCCVDPHTNYGTLCHKTASHLNCC
mmetsp:Transcript_56054/g.162374  ORF Transcript_56054/g.162374 Transcript_56054/m.162374 type:complete len:219 (-) Transcript_56054:111-767(-)